MIKNAFNIIERMPLGCKISFTLPEVVEDDDDIELVPFLLKEKYDLIYFVLV